MLAHPQSHNQGQDDDGVLPDSRERFLPRLIRLLHTALGFERLDEQSECNEIVQLVSDCTAYDPDESHTHDTAWLAIESHAREYCYELHPTAIRGSKGVEREPAVPVPAPPPYCIVYCDINPLLTDAADYTVNTTVYIAFITTRF